MLLVTKRVTLLSMLVICLPGYWFGAAVGIATATAYGLLQLIIEPYIISIPQLIVDYFLAFGALGLSGFFPGTVDELRGKYSQIYSVSLAALYSRSFPA